MTYLTEKEILERFEYYTLQVESQLLRGDEFDSLGNDVPFAVHLNDPTSLEVIHTNRTHAELTGYHVDQMREMGGTFLEQCVHPDSLAAIPRYLPSAYQRKDPSQTFSFVQRLRLRGPSEGFSAVITFTKPSRLPSGLVVCLSPLPKDFGTMAEKMDRIVEIDAFKLKNFARFQHLSLREVEVLRLLGGGCNNRQISDELHISRNTVETHRKRIKAKLELKSFADLMKYALAFDLIQF